jgi:isoquinoline 1-oxidoreductase beta subunit
VRDKTTGAAKFGIDSRPPGLLFAVVARCPVFGGKVASFDAAKAKAVPGVRDVIPFETSGRGASTTGGIAVLADNSWAAIQGRKALAVKWDEGPAANESTAELHKQFLSNAAKPGKVVRNDGDADSALGSSPKKIEAAYELPFAPHACMEPMNCTVYIRPDGAEAWVPTQAPQWAQGVIAEASKLPPEKVVVHTTLMGGGFGRRYQADFVMEAAQVAKAAGKPVMVLWTREDDMQHDFYRPASYHKMQGALDAKEISRPGNIFKPRPPSPPNGARKARRIRGWASSAPALPFLTSRRISASSTLSPNRACPAPGGAPSNTPAAASSWKVLLTSWRPPLARIR